MVNTGAPSKGCQTCRKRRIKCDEKRPVCGNCIKSKRECGGWRDEGGFVFQQESGIDKKQSLKRAGTKLPNLQGTAFRSGRTRSEPSNLETLDTASPVLLRSIPECVESQAMCFFVTECVLVPHKLHAEHAFIKHIAAPLYTQAKADSALVSIMSALSLRSFSYQPGREQLLFESEKYYGQAVSRLNQALASPTECKTDSTLLSVLMLLIRETMSMTGSSTMTWRQHVRGAVELVKLRGRGSFVSNPSKLLFGAVRENMYSLYLSSARAIPEEDIENIWMTPPEAGTRTSHALLDTAMPLPSLRERASVLFQLPMTSKVAQDTMSVLISLRGLDSKLAAWQFTVSVDWEYQVVGRHELGADEDFITSSVWPGDWYIYKNRHVAKGWNTYRVIRLVCHCIMVNCLERLVPPEQLWTHPEFTSSQRTIQRLANAICGTVSYITMAGTNDSPASSWRTDWKSPQDLTSSDDVSKPRFRRDLDKHQPASLNIGSLGIIWDLHIVATLSYIPPEQRDWARHQMDILAQERGLDQAQVLRAQGDEKMISRERDIVMKLTDMAPLPYEPIEDDPFESLVDPVLRPSPNTSVS